MAVAFLRGSTTGPNDLLITVRDSSSTLIDPYSLTYAVFDYTTGVEVLIGSPVNTPLQLSTGNYYADVVIAADANIGMWRIRWTIQETAVSPVYQSVQEFQVVGSNVVTSVTGDANFDALIHSLRVILRDNQPDRNYRFRPPSSEKFIQGQTQVFGFIWEDEELVEYIYMAIDDFNSRPPTTAINTSNLWGTERRWRTTVILRAAAFACFAIAMNWVADEFSVDKMEKLILRIGPDGEDFNISIGTLFQLLYSDSLEEGREIAIKGINELERNNAVDTPLKTDDGDQIVLDKSSLKDAYKNKNLFVQSMRDSIIGWFPIEVVARHECPNKKIFRITTDIGSVIVTEDHSLFHWVSKEPVVVNDLRIGETLVSKQNGIASPIMITGMEEIEKRQYMYDLSVPMSENFFLASGILAHNSYSISGVSLDIEKSSKYQAMKDEYINEYDKLVEANKRSIKIIKGLQQARYGIGVSSALGPMSRPGVQSRRNLISPGYGPYF